MRLGDREETAAVAARWIAKDRLARPEEGSARTHSRTRATGAALASNRKSRSEAGTPRQFAHPPAHEGGSMDHDGSNQPKCSGKREKSDPGGVARSDPHSKRAAIIQTEPVTCHGGLHRILPGVRPIHGEAEIALGKQSGGRESGCRSSRLHANAVENSIAVVGPRKPSATSSQCHRTWRGVTPKALALALLDWTCGGPRQGRH